MKFHSLAIVFILSLFVSTAALAEGAGCDKNKGHTKDLTADMLKDGSGHHEWMFSGKEAGAADPSVSDSTPAEQQPAVTTGKLLEI